MRKLEFVKIKLSILFILVILTLACGGVGSSVNKSTAIVVNKVIGNPNKQIEDENVGVNAVVISDYDASIFDKDSADSVIRQNIKQYSTVKVYQNISSSAWCFVKSEQGVTGWMHKSTLKIEERTTEPPRASTPKSKVIEPKVPPLTAPTQEQDDISIDQRIIGDRNTKFYYPLRCGDQRQINATAVVWFKSELEALESGYKIAEDCK